MKLKLLIVFILFFFITSCFFKNKYTPNVHTIIENDSNKLIAINYPETKIKKIDNKIEAYIKKVYKDFNNRENIKSLKFKDELNIDYDLFEFDNYVSIVINTYMNINKNSNTLIETYLFDLKNNKFLDINNIINTDKIVVENPNINLDKFFIDSKHIHIYDDKEYKFKIDKIEFKKNISINNNLNTTFIDNDIDSVKVSNIIDSNKKVIAITFDDGPSRYTKKIIDILKENDAVATFFVLGNKVESYQETLKKSIEYGNEIGNHSYNHKWLIKLNDTQIKEQIEKTQTIIYETLGYTSTLLRPTYGSVNKSVRKSSDLRIVLWNVDTMDWKYKSVDRIVKRATSNLKDGNIILMHDTYSRSAEALKKIIPIIKKEGFELVTISELLEINYLKNNA